MFAELVLGGRECAGPSLFQSWQQLPALPAKHVFSDEPSRAPQAVKERLHRATEVAVVAMLQALIREPIQTRQAADACVRFCQRYRASHVTGDHLLDPLWAKVVTNNQHAL
jgi:hypothetical protein